MPVAPACGGSRCRCSGGWPDTGCKAHQLTSACCRRCCDLQGSASLPPVLPPQAAGSAGPLRLHLRSMSDPSTRSSRSRQPSTSRCAEHKPVTVVRGGRACLAGGGDPLLGPPPVQLSVWPPCAHRVAKHAQFAARASTIHVRIAESAHSSQRLGGHAAVRQGKGVPPPNTRLEVPQIACELSGEECARESTAW